jgi:uncharacterized protein (TIGR02265 family)
MFDHVVEGLFQRSLGKKLSAAGRANLKVAGLDLEKPLRPAYPFLEYVGFLEIAARDVYPDKSMQDAMFELGAGFLDGYLDTLMGRAILNFAKLLGPARAIRRSGRTWRQGNNFTQVEVIERNETCFELRFNVVGPYPEHTQGALYGALRVNEDLDVEVKLLERVGDGATYLLSWRKKAAR